MMRTDYPSFIEGLRSKNILAHGDHIMGLLTMAMTLGTARWAFNSAARMFSPSSTFFHPAGLRDEAILFYR
jgi:hypothetical protein